MSQELGWSKAREKHEWTETVRFLESMGLSQEQLQVSRDEVVSGETKVLTPKQKAQGVSSKLNIPFGQLESNAGGSQSNA